MYNDEKKTVLYTFIEKKESINLKDMLVLTISKK